MLAVTGEHKEESFKVIQYLLSEDMQLVYAKAGRIPASTKIDLRKHFGGDLPALKGKNVEVVYHYKPASQYTPSLYDTLVQKEMNKAYDNVYEKKTDINSALREAEELANQAIAAETRGKSLLKTLL